MYVSPTEEELFKVYIPRHGKRFVTCRRNDDPQRTNHAQRYNPELQKRSLENREQKQQDFDDFVCNLKEASKSKKPSTYSIHRIGGEDANHSQSGQL
jgi:hypothetical protein